MEPAIPSSPDDRKKLGRYSGGNLNVPGYGHRTWVVLAYIIPVRPIGDYLKDGLTEDELVTGCIEFLNQPPTKRSRKPKYGSLTCNSFYFMEDKISVSLVIDQRNSKYFWGRGNNKQSMSKKYSKKGRRRSSPGKK